MASSKANILFMAPEIGRVSETWLTRMLDVLQPELSFIAVNQSIPDHIQGREVFELQPEYTSSTRAFVDSKLERVFPSMQKKRLGELRRKIREQSITKILINYATFAEQTRMAWENADAEVFIHCHGTDIHFDARSDEYPHSNTFTEAQIARIRRLADRAVFIANSRFTQQGLVHNGIPEERVRVKYFGVENAAPKAIPASNLKCLYLGRLVDWKGPELVIRSFELACERGFTGLLTLTGDGPLMIACELLKAESPFSDRIKILGAVERDQAEKLMSEHDVFLAHNRKGPLTNREEAFGVSIIEAMAHGLPVITGASGGVKESVVHGQTGFLIQPGNVDAMAQHLLTLDSSRELLQSLSTKAQAHAQMNFSIESERSQLLEIMGLAEPKLSGSA